MLGATYFREANRQIDGKRATSGKRGRESRRSGRLRGGWRTGQVVISDTERGKGKERPSSLHATGQGRILLENNTGTGNSGGYQRRKSGRQLKPRLKYKDKLGTLQRH